MTFWGKKELWSGLTKTKKIDKWELEIMKLYLDAGYSIYDVIELRLLSGKGLPEGKEFNVNAWLKEQNLTVIIYLLDFLPLNTAIGCYLQISLFKGSFKEKLVKVLLYPAIQLFLAFLISLAAQYWVMPLLGDLMGNLSEGDDVNVLSSMLTGINYLIVAALFFLTVFLILISKLEPSLMVVMLNKPVFKIFKDFVVYQFVNYYLIFYQATDAIELVVSGLRKLPDAKFINVYADKIHFSLADGNPLASTMRILDERLETIFRIGNDTGRIDELLPSYIMGLNMRFENFLKKTGRNFQIFSYVYIMLLVVMVYQMMLLPLAMIERM